MRGQGAQNVVEGGGGGVLQGDGRDGLRVPGGAQHNRQPSEEEIVMRGVSYPGMEWEPRWDGRDD